MKLSIFAAVVLTLAGTSAAMADGREDHDGHHWSVGQRESDGRHGRDWRDSHQEGWSRDERESRRHADEKRWHNQYDRRYRDEHDWRAARYPQYEYRSEWENSEHAWRRGERLPTVFYAPPYSVVNYGNYGLREPPHGCRWIRVNNDVVLTAVATGVVLDAVYNIF